MKKRITSILLVMVIIFTMTACVKNTDTQLATSEATTNATIEVANAEATEPTVDILHSVNLYGVIYESELNVKPVKTETLKMMTTEEVSNFFAEMVRMSEEENLSAADMHIIGHNFEYIWDRNHFDNYPTFEQSDFEAQAYKAFCNIYDKALKEQLPLEELSVWADIPVADVLYKYFSSSNFYAPEFVYGFGIRWLKEEDFIRVTEAFFNNPLMDNNCDFPHQVIMCDINETATDMAWEHLVTLSKSSDLNYNTVHEHFRYTITEILCSHILATVNAGWPEEPNFENIDKIAEIAKNILENPEYDISQKYHYFCYAYYDHMSNTYENQTIADMAFESLFELAKNATDEEATEIRNLTRFLERDVANELLSILEENS